MRSGNSTRPPSPKVKASGGEPVKRSVRLGLQHMLGVGIADRQHVAMEMHGALRLAGGAGGERDQADVVAGGVAGGELLVAGLHHQRFERVRRGAAPIDHALQFGRLLLRLLHLVGEPRVAQRQRDLRLGERIGQLLGAQQRHGRDHDAARLDDREIGRDHHRIVGGAQQHAVARHHAEIARQHIGDAVHALVRLARRSALPSARAGTAGRPARPRPSGRPIAVTQLSRSGYCSSGRSNLNSGHCARGGRLSRANVST